MASLTSGPLAAEKIYRRFLEHGPCRHALAALLTAGMVLDEVVQVECAAGCGHRLYSDRGPLECPLPLARRRKRFQIIARTLQQGSSLALLRRQSSANSSCSSTMVSLM